MKGATPRQQAVATQGATPRHLPLPQHQTPAMHNTHTAAQGSTQGSAPGGAQESTQGSTQGFVRGAAQGSRGRAGQRGNGYPSDRDGADGPASPGADAQSASSQEEEVQKASRQEPPAAVRPVQQDDSSQQTQQAGTSGQEAQQAGEVTGASSSRSIDRDDDGMLDRFGSVDIITGKPVRDLKLDPVRQLVKWRESIFGSRDSVSESVDKDDEGPSN